MQKVLYRCNGGDYYSGRACPFDGWSRPELQRVFDAVAEMKTSGALISISALRERGFDKGVLDRVIVVEFGAEAAAFDAFHAEGFFIDGKYVKAASWGIT